MEGDISRTYPFSSPSRAPTMQHHHPNSDAGSGGKYEQSRSSYYNQPLEYSHRDHLPPPPAQYSLPPYPQHPPPSSSSSHAGSSHFYQPHHDFAEEAGTGHRAHDVHSYGPSSSSSARFNANYQQNYHHQLPPSSASHPANNPSSNDPYGSPSEGSSGPPPSQSYPPLFNGWNYPPPPPQPNHPRDAMNSAPSYLELRSASLPDLYPHIPSNHYHPQRGSMGDLNDYPAYSRVRDYRAAPSSSSDLAPPEFNASFSSNGGGAGQPHSRVPSRVSSAGDMNYIKEEAEEEEEEAVTPPKIEERQTIVMATDGGISLWQKDGVDGFKKARGGRTDPPKDAANRKYPCTECHQKFARPSALATHILSHTKEKPFSCLTCDRRFAVMSNLRRHCRVRNHDIASATRAPKSTTKSTPAQPPAKEPRPAPVPGLLQIVQPTPAGHDGTPPPWTAMFHGISPTSTGLRTSVSP